MITKYEKTQTTESLLAMIQDRDMTTLKSMYPNISADELQNKYKLFLYFDYYCKWGDFSNIYANVQIKTKDNQEVILPQYKLRHPYPNKCYSHIAMRKGRKISRCGIPLIFDTYEELSKISEINVTWLTRFKSFSYAMLISYSIDKFIYKENNTFYGIFNKDFNPHSISPFIRQKKILEEYNTVIICFGDELVRTSKIDMPEDEAAKDLLEKYAHIVKTLSEHDIPINNDTMVDIFQSNIILRPFKETRMVPAFY